MNLCLLKNYKDLLLKINPFIQSVNNIYSNDDKSKMHYSL